MNARMWCAFAACLTGVPLAGQAIAITGGTVITGTGARLDGATVVIAEGRIQAVGTGVAVPAGATVVDATGKYVYPGLIDSRTRLGLSEIGSVAGGQDLNEQGDMNPAMATVIAVHPHSELIPVARVSGITTVMTAPTGGRIPGMATLIDLDGWTPDQMARRRLAGLMIDWPNLERTGGGGFGGFGGGGQQGSDDEIRRRGERQIWELQEYFASARSYTERQAAGATVAYDRQLEAMRPVMRGEVPVIVNADTPDQIRGAIAFADTFGLRLILEGGRQAWQLADTLAELGVPLILGSILSSPRDDEPFDAIYAQPGVLARAGVRFAFASGDAANVRNLPYHAAMAVAHGLDQDMALAAMTRWPAEMWGIGDEVGTIEQGKVANLFIATGDPMDVRSTVDQVFIRGRAIEMETRHTRLYEQFRGRPGN